MGRSGCCSRTDSDVSLNAARRPGAEGGGNLDRWASAAVRGGGVDGHRHARRDAAGRARTVDLGGLNGALKEGGRSEGAIGVGTRRLLIVCEVALSLVLLMGAGVMIQSLLALRHGDTGFDPNNVLTMRVRLVDAQLPVAGTAFVIL